MNQARFVLDLDRCVGCAACIVACNTENPVGEELSWRAVHTFNRQKFAMAPIFHYSLACNHCSKPACLLLCPADAYHKDPQTGAVLVDRERCMGCRYCSWVCPYGAPQFNNREGVMEKCTFCRHRQEGGLEPACVTACPTEALGFEVGATPNSSPRPGFPDTGLKPSLQIVGSRREDPPEMAVVSMSAHDRPLKHKAYGWSGLRTEWSLWLFTSVATWLVAWFAAAVTTQRPIVFPAFVAAAILAMGVSALHLGRAVRMWRAVMNLRRSWISREIVAFGLFFVGVCSLEMGLFKHTFLAWSVVVCGWAALVSMDMVYRIPGQRVGSVPHSAMATLTAALYVGILVEAPVVVMTVAFLKLILFVSRGGMGRPGGWELGLLRIVAGLLIPAVAMVEAVSIGPGFVLGAAAFGELIDRARFYAALSFLSPASQIDRDLRSSLSS